MDAAFDRVEKGLEFAMSNGYREEMDLKRKNCNACKIETCVLNTSFVVFKTSTFCGGVESNSFKTIIKGSLVNCTSSISL